MNRIAPSLLAVGLMAAPASALAQSVEDLQIRAWRETWELPAWSPAANTRLKGNGNRASLATIQCGAMAGPTVGMVVERKANSKNPVSAYRGQSGAYCAPKGVGLIEATLQACHLRFRPIIMTSLAFILGVLPLVLANGAGSAAQRAIGTGVMSGMIAATVLAVFFVPVFFVVVMTWLNKGSKHPKTPNASEAEVVPHD